MIAFGVVGRHAVERQVAVARVDSHAGGGVRLVKRRVGLVDRASDDAANGEVERASELEIALIVPWHGHDRAGAVAHQYIISDPNRDFAVVDRVDRVSPSEHSGFRLRQVGAIEIRLRRGGLAIGGDGRAVFAGGEAVDQGVFGGEDDVGGAEKGVGPGGEDADGVEGAGLVPDGGLGLNLEDVVRAGVVIREIDQRPLATADPVALHVLDGTRPVERFEVLDQSVGIRGDAEHPLAQGHADDGVAAALALAVDDLFVRQHGPQLRAPIDGHLGAIRQALRVAIRVGIDPRWDRQLADRAPLADALRALRVGPAEGGVVPGVEELEEDPLGPAVVRRVGGVDLAVPVVGEAQGFDLSAEGVDVLLGGDGRMRAGLDGVLLGGESESVPAHRVKDVEPAHPLVAADDVGGRVAFRVADVQARAAGIGEHVEHVELGLAGDEVAGAERLLTLPAGLPPGLDLLEVIRGHDLLSSLPARVEAEAWSPSHEKNGPPKGRGPSPGPSHHDSRPARKSPPGPRRRIGSDGSVTRDFRGVQSR